MESYQLWHLEYKIYFQKDVLEIFIEIFLAQGAKQSMEFLSKKSKSMMAVRKIGKFEEDFNTSDFADQAQEIYIKAHKALAE